MVQKRKVFSSQNNDAIPTKEKLGSILS